MTITKEGTLASFYTVNKAPIKHLRVYFSPQQAGSGTASPSNERPINNITECNILFSGKNIFNINRTIGEPNPKDLSGATSPRIMNIEHYYKGIQSENWYYTSYTNTSVTNNTITVTNLNNNAYGVGFPVKINGNEKYTLSFNSEKSLISFGYYDKDWHYLNSSSSYTNINNITITTPQDAQYIVIVFRAAAFNAETYTYTNIQLELGEQATTYEPYHNNTYTLDWANEAGTAYGGYIDLVTGELVEEYIKRQVTEFTGVLGECKNGYCAYVYDAAYDHTVSKLNQSYMKCNYFEYSPYGRGAAGGTSNGMPLYTYGGDNGGLGTHGFILPSTITSLAEANAWLNNLSTPLECIIRLKNPNTYTLTPQQLETFIGRNNIWSNADRIEVEYDLAESNDELYRRRNILLNTPHIETIDNNIAVFNTDMIAPIKEAKVYFNCRQSSGTPSLTTPRDIYGHTNIEVYSYGENLFNINTDMVGSRYIDYTTGNLVSWGYSWNVSTFLPIESNTTYTLRCANTGLSNAGLAFYDINQTYISGIRNNHSNTVPTATTTFITPSNAAYIRFTFVEPLNYLTVFVKGESIPNLNTYSEDWSTIGELYGGYIDLNTGNIYKTYNKRNLKDYTFGYYTGYQYYLTCSDRKKTSTNLLSNLFPISTTKGYPQVNKTLGYYSNGASYANIIFIRYEDAGEGAQSPSFNSWLQSLENNPYIVYEMEEPEYVATLTPHSLKSLRGKNIIQGNGRGPVSIKYWTH